MLEPSAGFPVGAYSAEGRSAQEIERGRDHEKEDGMFTGLDGAAECADRLRRRLSGGCLRHVAAETPMTPEETEFQSGRVEGGTYTNEFLSVACQLGDEWTYLTDEEIAQLNGEIGESLTDEELSEMFSNGKTVQDMYAASADGTATINVIFEDMGVLYGAALDEDAYINLVMPTLEDALMQAGMSDIQVEAGSMEFAGADHSTLRVTSTISEIPVYELMVCVKEGNYMGVITLASYLEDTTEEMGRPGSPPLPQ